jgi:hypothetical protein
MIIATALELIGCVTMIASFLVALSAAYLGD